MGIRRPAPRPNQFHWHRQMGSSLIYGPPLASCASAAIVSANAVPRTGRRGKRYLPGPDEWRGGTKPANPGIDESRAIPQVETRDRTNLQHNPGGTTRDHSAGCTPVNRRAKNLSENSFAAISLCQGGTICMREVECRMLKGEFHLGRAVYALAGRDARALRKHGISHARRVIPAIEERNAHVENEKRTQRLALAGQVIWSYGVAPVDRGTVARNIARRRSARGR